MKDYRLPKVLLIVMVAFLSTNGYKLWVAIQDLKPSTLNVPAEEFKEWSRLEFERKYANRFVHASPSPAKEAQVTAASDSLPKPSQEVQQQHLVPHSSPRAVAPLGNEADADLTIPRQKGPRLFIYFIHDKEKIKAELLYNNHPDEVLRFMTRIRICDARDRKTKAIRVSWKKFGPVKASEEYADRFNGQIFYNSGSNEQELLLEVGSRVPVPQGNYHPIAGVISDGELAKLRIGNGELSYPLSNVMLTYRLQLEDAPEDRAAFRHLMTRYASVCSELAEDYGSP